jgi:hypothetical protein
MRLEIRRVLLRVSSTDVLLIVIYLLSEPVVCILVLHLVIHLLVLLMLSVTVFLFEIHKIQ